MSWKIESASAGKTERRPRTRRLTKEENEQEETMDNQEQLDELFGKGKLNDIIKHHRNMQSDSKQKRDAIGATAEIAKKQGLKIDDDDVEDKVIDHLS